MSLELSVYGTEPASTDHITSAIEEIGDLRLVGDAGAVPMSVVVERELRGSFEHAASLDGPFDCEAEDLPPAVVANAVGVRVMYQFVVEGGSQPSFKLANRLARVLASASSGVVYDPQRDAVTWPRGRGRAFEARRDDLIDVVEYSWYVRREDAPSDLPTVLIRQLEAYVPEALPRRFGSYEPLQFKYDVVGEAAFVEQWKAEAVGLFWKARKPCFGGSTLGLASGFGRPTMPHPIGTITLSFDSRAFDDARWRRDLEALFVSFAEKSEAFCAVAEVDTNLRYSGGSLLHGPEAETTWRLAVRGQWQGLPPDKPWLLWMGPAYCDFLGVRGDAGESAGRLLRRSETPRSQQSVGRLRSLLRRGSSQRAYDQIPAEARMVSTGSPGRGGERIRAAEIPAGL